MLTSSSLGQEAGSGDQGDPWLRSVTPIILEAERALYTSLEAEYERAAFRERFWRERDNFEQTARNEFRERYELRLGAADADFGGLEDDRARILLTHGEPSRIVDVRCTATRIPASIWVYRDSELVNFGFVLVFLQRDRTRPVLSLWRPSASGAADIVVRGARSCLNGGILEDVANQVVAAGPGYDRQLDTLLRKPRPRSLEWVSAFRASSTRVPEGAPRFEAVVDVSFPARSGLRTLSLFEVTIESDALEVASFAGYRSQELRVVGEVVQGNDLFETFRYGFGFPAEDPDARLLRFHRLLRPGAHRVIFTLEDLHGKRFFQFDREIEVPRVSAEVVLDDARAREGESAAQTALEALTEEVPELELLAPVDRLQTGFTNVAARVQSDLIRRVAFYLDDRLILTKNRAPFEVEIDLGPFPRLRRLAAEGLSSDGEVLARDLVELNGGRQRFAVHLTSPASGSSTGSTVRAQARLTVPEGRTVDRLEFLVNDRIAATLFQEPWEALLELPSVVELSYLRVAAYLADGYLAEDGAFLNSPQPLEELEVQIVEPFVTVQDRQGRFVEGLSRDSFRVFEDGVEQTIQRFSRVDEVPIQVGVLLDNSASMAPVLGQARSAVLTFFERVLRPADRAAVITFNRFPNLAVPLTSELPELGAGLAGLAAEGQTSLFDSIVFGLYYLEGVAGQRALLVLSDGRDETSEADFEQALRYAQRAGVTLYTISLGGNDPLSRSQLRRLAVETGGAFYVAATGVSLEEIYRRIEGDLRAQYFLSYQSSNTDADEEFRRVEVRVEGYGRDQVRTMSGYYP